MPSIFWGTLKKIKYLWGYKQLKQFVCVFLKKYKNTDFVH